MTDTKEPDAANLRRTIARRDAKIRELTIALNAMEERFNRIALNQGFILEQETGAACVAWYRDIHVANGQATPAECFDAAWEEVWGDWRNGGCMRPEFAARLKEHEAARPVVSESTEPTREQTAPALTPEEWNDRALAEDEGDDGISIDAQGDPSILSVTPCVRDRDYGWRVGMGERQRLDIGRRHALAALALHGQPFGFTHHDVNAIRHFADAYDLTMPQPFRDHLNSLASRIAALLPPNRVPSEST